ncbi:hypothetical protein SEA_BRIAKILA_41 [Mycobacterium phage Briakila]|nr:hypothetical protein RITA1961_40 [Mycobacterium phage Rita1961]UYL86494.1 hypothetical protein SEA_BRIAKILA_41 [Mycobacterium phage Briakila]WGH20917.1 hypothetical protein SEA_MMASICARM_40 [Mycobacterium phage MmasiCarm]
MLDHIESIALESFVGGKTAEHDKLQREAFLDKLYAPDPEHRMLNGEEYVPKPSAFEDPKAIEDGFDSFMGAVSRRRAR